MIFFIIENLIDSGIVITIVACVGCYNNEDEGIQENCIDIEIT